MEEKKLISAREAYLELLALSKGLTTEDKLIGLVEVAIEDIEKTPSLVFLKISKQVLLKSKATNVQSIGTYKKFETKTVK